MKLKDWLETNEITETDFARMIGVRGVKSVYRYVNGERIPERNIMSKIVEATRGQVTANSFYQ